MRDDKLYQTKFEVAGYPVYSVVSNEMLETIIHNGHIEELSNGKFHITPHNNDPRITETLTREQFDFNLQRNARSALQSLTINNPSEMALLLSRAKQGQPLGYMLAHGGTYEGQWHFSVGKDLHFPVTPKLIDSLPCSGVVLSICNPGGHLIEGANMPTLYPTKETSILDRLAGLDGYVLNHPEMLSQVPYEQKQKIISNFLQGCHSEFVNYMQPDEHWRKEFESHHKKDIDKAMKRLK